MSSKKRVVVVVVVVTAVLVQEEEVQPTCRVLHTQTRRGATDKQLRGKASAPQIDVSLLQYHRQ